MARKLSQLPFEGPLSTLISRKLLEECEPWGASNWPKLIAEMDGDGVFQYPDGSLEVFHDRLTAKQAEHFNELWQTVYAACNKKREAENRPTGREGLQTQFRGLWGPRRSYTLWYPDAAQRGLGDMSLLVVPGAWNEIEPNETQLERLNVTVICLKKPDAECRQSLSSLIGHWTKSVSENGVDNEGAVKPAQSCGAWQGRAFSLFLDFSVSGQATLNWLLLWLVNHTEEYPLEYIIFGHPDSALVSSFRKSKIIHQEANFETMPENSKTSKGIRLNPPSPFNVFRSHSFRADMGTIEIEFSSPPNDVQLKEIEMVIQAWLLVGMFGGFQGNFSDHSDVSWKNAEDSSLIKVQVDFGLADLHQSLSTLRRLVENISKETLQVESLNMK